MGELPSGSAEQAKVKWLPDKVCREAVAEIHCDIKFLKELNHDNQLKEGDQ